VTTKDRAWHALSARLFEALSPVAKGALVGGTHVRRFEDNLVPGFSVEQVQQLRGQLAAGAGRELTPTATLKRRAHAPYSSAALAINAFGRWLGSEEHLRIVGLGGFDRPLTVEHKFRIKHRGGTANLDSYLEGPYIVVGVESKLTEHLAAHGPVTWEPPYGSSNVAELLSGGWKQTLQDSLAGRWTPSYLGLEQLLKHALALNSHADCRPTHLVYCYWEPENGDDFDEVVRHRMEVANLMQRVGDAEPLLHATTYARCSTSGPRFQDQTGLSDTLRS
jgi:Restriction Endonuclease associating with ARP